MDIKSKIVPPMVLPYKNIEGVIKLQTKLFESTSFLPFLPLINPDENVLKYTLNKIPFIKFEKNKIRFRLDSKNFSSTCCKFDNIYNNPTDEALEEYYAPLVFTDKFFALLKRLQPKYAYINFYGAFSLLQMFENVSENSGDLFLEKNLRKFITQMLYIKITALTRKIRKINSETTPIVILEEPLLDKIGELKRQNEEITSEFVSDFLAVLIKKLHADNVKVVIKSLSKCDWQIPINAETDMIYYDAYNNPNNLVIIPDKITEYIQNGGLINWAILPTTNETIVKDLTIDALTKRLNATFAGLSQEGVPPALIYKSALVSLQSENVDLPLIFAEKAIILCHQLSKKIPVA